MRLMKEKIVFTMMLITCFFAQNKKTQFNVEFISAENIYLDGGKKQGLSEGDQLLIMRNKTDVFAEIEVIFAADFSASCKILSSKGQIRKGDIAVKTGGESTTQNSQPEDWLIKSSILSPPETREKKSSVPLARISGSAAAQFYQMDDRTVNSLDFSQTTFRINLRAQKLFGKDLTFRFRTRTRRNERARDYLANDIPQNEWRNRLYELSLSFHNRNAPVNFSLGRIYSMPLSGIGYVDGGQVQVNLSQKFSAGILAGSQPNLRNTNPRPSLQKYSAYLNYTSSRFQPNRFQTTLAGVAEYSGSTVSREFLYTPKQFRTGRQVQFFSEFGIGYQQELA